MQALPKACGHEGGRGCPVPQAVSVGALQSVLLPFLLTVQILADTSLKRVPKTQKSNRQRQYKVHQACQSLSTLSGVDLKTLLPKSTDTLQSQKFSFEAASDLPQCPHSSLQSLTGLRGDTAGMSRAASRANFYSGGGWWTWVGHGQGTFNPVLHEIHQQPSIDKP